MQLSCPGKLKESFGNQSFGRAAAQDKGAEQPRQYIAFGAVVNSQALVWCCGAQLEQITLIKGLRECFMGHSGRVLSI